MQSKQVIIIYLNVLNNLGTLNTIFLLIARNWDAIVLLNELISDIASPVLAGRFN